MPNVYTAAKNTFFKKNLVINCRGKLMDLAIPRIMGILNLTPDSFYDGGKYAEIEQILGHVEDMILQGADIIDVGGISSRPGSDEIGLQEELDRIMPTMEAITKAFPEAVISIDTFRSEVADACLNYGASIINDIYGGSRDEEIFTIAAGYSAPFVIMHMQNNPANMQESPDYDDVVAEVSDFLIHQSMKARAGGVKDVILDPGFGFGKTIEHNYQLLAAIDYLNMIFEKPYLSGGFKEIYDLKTCRHGY